MSAGGAPTAAKSMFTSSGGARRPLDEYTYRRRTGVSRLQ